MEPDYESLPRERLIEEILILKNRGTSGVAEGRPAAATDEDLRLLQALSGLGQTILDTLDLDQIVDRLAHEIVRIGYFRSLMVALVDEERSEVVVAGNYVCVRDYPIKPRFTPAGTSITPIPNVTHYSEGAVVTDQKIIGITYPLDDSNITPTVARTGRLEVIEGGDDRFDEFSGPPEERRRNVAYFIPVKKGDRVLAVLGTGSTPEDKEATLRQIEQIQPLLSQVAIALEHARLYRALQRQQKRQEVTLGSIGEGVITADGEGRLQSLNGAAERLTGWTEAEAVGRGIEEVLQLLDEDTGQKWRFSVELLRGADGGGWQNRPMRLLGRGVPQAHILASCAPMRGDGGEGAVLVIRDVTQQRKVEAERVRTQRLESLGVLAGGVAHDFNNCLGSVLINVSMLQFRLQEAEGLGVILNDIERALLQARELTQQLVTFAKGKAPERTTASLGQVIRQAAVFALRGTNVECRCQIAEDLWTADIDATQITQVTHNLVLNAVQAMPHGGRITLSLANCRVDAGVVPKAGHYVLCSIADEGTGIRPEHLDRIFDPYFSTKKDGNGLGLTSAFAIVNSHEGWLTAEPRAGGGTVFHMYLPASRKEAPAPAADAPAEPVALGRVLLMDDDAGLVEAAGRALESLGYNVERAHTGEEVLVQYRRLPGAFDAVVLDLTVPGGMGGTETAAQLLQLDPQARIIASTGHTNAPEVKNYRRFGYDAVITKPYTVAELVQTLNEVMGRHRSRIPH